MDENVKQIKDLLRGVLPGNETTFDVARDVLEDGTNKSVLTVIQRRVNPEPPVDPIKAPSPRRSHCFHHLDGFIAYLKRFGGENTVVLADVERETITAILDEQADRGFECVQFTPQIHPLFAPWNAILGKLQRLRTFVDFLAENRRAVTAPIGKDLVRTMSQVKVSRKLDLHQGFGKNSINGVMVELNISGQAKESLVELPDEIVLTVPLYVAMSPVELTLDLTLDATEELGVVVKLTSSDLLEQRTGAFTQFIEKIEFELGSSYTVGLGRPQYAPWDVLREGGR